MPFHFFREIQLATVLILIHDSYIIWITRFILLKVCMGFSIVDSLWFLLKFIFFFKPMILNDIETDLETNFLNPENWSFENVVFLNSNF